MQPAYAVAIVGCLLCAYAIYWWGVDSYTLGIWIWGIGALGVIVGVSMMLCGGALIMTGGNESDATLNPPLRIVDYSVAGKTLHVIRDDLLEAGTKQRAIVPYFRAAAGARVRSVMYTAPHNGYGPVVSAMGASLVGLPCRLVLSLKPFGGGQVATPAEADRLCGVRIMRKYGAQIEYVPDWGTLVRRGQEIVAADDGVLWLPLGLNDPVYMRLLADAIRVAAEGSALEAAAAPRIWVVGGTGIIAEALGRALPRAIVMVVPAEHGEKLAARGLRVVEGSHPRASKPPYPSVPNYDAKAWAAAVEYGRDGDYVWNVAGAG